MTELVNTQLSVVREFLPLLLADKTTKKTILWATDSYDYPPESEMLPDQIQEGTIRPRVLKARESQNNRTKTFAEVFTPSWICNLMNNHADEEWFGRANVFNTENDQTWIPSSKAIEFPEGKNWKEYVDSRRIEITCGEAPFVVSRYDAATGDILELPCRMGILDRKLRIVNENTSTEEEWMEWTLRAFQSVYGYEFQGDNLLIARINLFMTFIEYTKARWNHKPTKAQMKTIANVISWNFWQMDGYTNTVPFSKETDEQLDLFNFDDSNEDRDCLIYDWRGKNASLKYRFLGGKK